MKILTATNLAKTLSTVAVVAAVAGCSVINLSDLGIPNPLGGNEDVPPPADPTTAASTYIGPQPTDFSQPGTGGFGAGVQNTTPGFGATSGSFGTGMVGAVAPGSDPRPVDPTAARAYDMIVERAQANCAVAPLIIGFGRVNGGYNANASCPTGAGSAMTPGTNALGALGTPPANSGFGILQ